MLDYKNNLLNEEWDYIDIKNSEIYNITVFDDGNQRYEEVMWTYKSAAP